MISLTVLYKETKQRSRKKSNDDKLLVLDYQLLLSTTREMSGENNIRTVIEGITCNDCGGITVAL